MSREMKDSGVEWIGQIPEEWNIGKIDQLYSLRSTKVSDKDYPPLSVTMKGIVPQLDSTAKTDDHDNRKLVKKGDFAINSRSDRWGSCGISDYDGSVSLINTVLKPRHGMCNAYYNWLFHSDMFSSEFYKWGHGIVDDLRTTNWQEMKKMSIPAPSLEEQKIVSDFLDRKCSAIDTAIEKTKKSIEKLEEYKKAVITKAVTKGLDPDAKMKDSGVEGLGMIPESWDTCPMKTLFLFGKGLSITKDDLTEDGVPVLSYGQIHSKSNPKVFTPTDLLRYVPEDKAKKQSLTDIGDFIFADTSEDRDGCGNCNYIDAKGIYAGYHTIIARAKGITDNKYFGYLFDTDAWRFQMRRELTEVKLYSVSQKVLKNTVILLPTEKDRKQIVSYLDSKCISIDALITKKKKTITKWEEYKKSLIYYAVTGKIDCRNEVV